MKRGALLALALLAPAPAHAIIIVEETWRAQGGEDGDWDAGFAAHEALAAQPQFGALVAVSDNAGKSYGFASGVWLGNLDGFGYILTAAHVIEDPALATRFAFRSAGGTERIGAEAWVHPGWNSDVNATGGVDFAIVRLDGPIEDAGEAPVLYSGRDELGRSAVLVGYGTRGVAPYGHGYRFAPRHYDTKAAAENVVDRVTTYLLSIDLDEPHGAGKNRIGEREPISELEGILAPGDSGGALWMQFDGEWRIVGVNSSGDPGADYQDTSNFARVTTQRGWIHSVFPAARFSGDKTE